MTVAIFREYFNDLLNNKTERGNLEKKTNTIEKITGVP